MRRTWRNTSGLLDLLLPTLGFLLGYCLSEKLRLEFGGALEGFGYCSLLCLFLVFTASSLAGTVLVPFETAMYACLLRKLIASSLVGMADGALMAVLYIVSAAKCCKASKCIVAAVEKGERSLKKLYNREYIPMLVLIALLTLITYLLLGY